MLTARQLSMILMKYLSHIYSKSGVPNKYIGIYQ